MPATLKEIGKILFDAELKFKVQENLNSASLVISTQRYLNQNAEKLLLVVVLLEEEGNYIRIFSPSAYKVPAERTALFMQACGIIQWRTKMVQFEFDEKDGEIRPVVEFPLEDASLTHDQLMRSIFSLVRIVDEFYPVLSRVISEGIIDFNLPDDNPGIDIEAFLDTLPEGLLEEALKRKKMK